MLTNYFTLRALVQEWSGTLSSGTLSSGTLSSGTLSPGTLSSGILPGHVLAEAWSQERGELTLAFDTDEEQGRALKISVQAPVRYVYLNPNTAKARKNVASIFPSISGEIVENVALARNDRPLEIRMRSGRVLRIELFGPRANVYLLDAGRVVEDRFRSLGAGIGERIEPDGEYRVPASEEAFVAEWNQTSGGFSSRLRKLYPVLGAELAGEVLRRASVSSEESDALVNTAGIWEALHQVLGELKRPEARIYWQGHRAMNVALISIGRMHAMREERFDSVSEAVRIFARRKLSQAAFDASFDPLDSVLRTRLKKLQKSRARMSAELERESRADTYEHYGHLLLALQNQVSTGDEKVTLDDVISGSGTVSIPLKAHLSAVQNAERYYGRAREARKSRKHATGRLESLDHSIKHIETLFNELQAVSSLKELEQYRRLNADELAALSPQRSGATSGVPFRRFDLGSGYEVWVGRNAAQNDLLTLKYARKHDLWLHARGVPGSHTVLRRPRRDENPPARIVEKAAAIAAHFSKAASSALVPVVVTEKRYVRKPSKSPQGTVVVEREKVLMVSPELPEG